MSTRSSEVWISDGGLHLFRETADDDRLTLEVNGLENPYSGGIYVEPSTLLDFCTETIEVLRRLNPELFGGESG